MQSDDIMYCVVWICIAVTAITVAAFFFQSGRDSDQLVRDAIAAGHDPVLFVCARDASSSRPTEVCRAALEATYGR